MKIVAALDRSAISDRVVAMARRLATCENGEILLLNVAPREAQFLGQQLTRTVIEEPVPDELQEQHQMLQHHAASLRQAGLRCTTLLVRGDPVRAVVREATRWGAELVVMGSHGRTGLVRQFVGSVSEAVMKSRQFPVLIIPSCEAAGEQS